MILTKRAIEMIDNRQFMLKMASVMGVGFSTAYRWVKVNSDNLTKASALKIIREETGLSDEDILEGDSAGCNDSVFG